MIQTNDRVFLKFFIMQKYENEKRELLDIIETCRGSFLKQYRKRFPCHLISHLYIKRFWSELSSMNLLPDKDEYITLNEKNEFFDISLSLVFEKTRNPMVLEFPYPINIHKVTSYIKKNEIPSVSLYVSTLEKLINPEYFDEFDRDMQAKREGRDLLDKIKSDNSIIVLCPKGIVNRGYLINGTHRTIQAIRNGLDTIEGYVVYPEVCNICGISENYESVYDMMRRMYLKVYGINRND